MKNEPESLLRIGEVSQRVGLSRSSIYRLISEGRFPAGISLTQRARAWPASAVNSWIAKRIQGEAA